MIASPGQRPRASRTSASHPRTGHPRSSARAGGSANPGSSTSLRTRRATHPLPKTLTCALLALSVIASSLLAVALTVAIPEPEPVAAHHNTGHTNISNLTFTEPRIDLAGTNDRTSDQGITYTVTSSNCDTNLHGLAAIDTNPKTPVNEGGTTPAPNKLINQPLDYRCDWTFVFTKASDASCLIKIVPKALDGTARTTYTAVNSIRLFKNPNHVGTGARHPSNWENIREDRRLLATPASSSSYDAAHNDNNVETLEVSCIGVQDLAALKFAVLDIEQFIVGRRINGRLQENPLIDKTPAELGITDYTLTPGDCESGITASNQSMSSRLSHPVHEKSFRHILNTRCSWEVDFEVPNTLCWVADPTVRSVNRGAVTTAYDDVDNIYTLPFTLLKNPSGSSSHGFYRGTPGFGVDSIENYVNVINVDVLSKANGQCVSRLLLHSELGEDRGDTWVNLVSMKNSQTCATNPASRKYEPGRYDFEKFPDVLSHREHNPMVLGRNCNWLITFRSLNPKCVTRAYLYDENDRLIRTLARFTGVDQNGNPLIYDLTGDTDPNTVSVPYTLQAGYGEENAATLRLTGEDDRLRFTTRQLLPTQTTPGVFEQVFVHHEVSRIEFVTCPAPRGASRVSIFDGTGSDYRMTYSIDPVQCAGINPPPSQTQDDAIDSSFYDASSDEDHVAGFDGARDQSHFLSFLCDWEVSFEVEPSDSSTATMTHCQVYARVDREGISTGDHAIFMDRDGVVYLEGDVPVPGANRNFAGDFQVNGTSQQVDGIYVSVVTSGGQCASDIELKNISPAGAGKQVEVAAIPDPTSCSPHDRGPKPASNLFLQGEQSSTLTLARNCAWKLVFSSRNNNCVASAQLKDTAGADIDTAITTSFATPEQTITLAKTDEGLPYSYDDDDDPDTSRVTYTYDHDSDPATPDVTPNVGAIEFNGCTDTLPADTVELTIMDDAGIHGFDSYEIEVPTNGCDSSVGTTPPKQTQADAIVSGSSYVHRLNHDCDWKITFAASTDGCSKEIEVKRSADGAAHSTTAGKTVTVYKDTDNDRLLAATGTAQVARFVSYALDASAAACVLPVEFVNMSAPLALAAGHAFRNAQGQLVAPAANRPQNSKGQIETLDDQIPEVELPFPQVAVNLTPLNTNGSACTTDSDTDTPSEPLTLDALTIVTTSEGAKLNKPVLDDQGNFVLTPTTTSDHSPKLDKSCGWLVEFATAGTVSANLECYASAQVRGHSGQRLGHAVLAGSGDGDLIDDQDTPDDRSDDVEVDGPFSGGALWLASGASGLTYTPASGPLAGTATAVGSIEFLGCLEHDYPGTATVQIVDDTGLAGELGYTIAPALCEGFAPPASQTNADGLVPTNFNSTEAVSNLYFHYLNYDCDWEITFTGKPACQDAVTVWEDTADGRVFADAVTETSEQGVVRVRLSPRHRSVLVSNPGGEHPDRNTNNNVSEELVPGLGYLPGSGGNRKLAADATGVPDGNSATPTELEVLPVSALSLECASEIEFASKSGLEGPGLELSVVSPGAVPSSASTSAAACVVNQDRLPGVSNLAAAESFSLALNRRCSWNVTFKSPAETCSAAVRVFDTATPPALVDTLWTIPGQSAAIALAANVAGLQYTPASGSSAGTATAVGALEFYNCFYPSVSLAGTDIPADTRFTVSFAVLGTQPGCTVAASQVVVTNDPTASLAQRAQSSIEGRGFSFRVLGERVLLNSLAGDGSLCEYDVRVAGPAEMGELVSLGDALTARTSHVTLERPRPAVALRNLTSAITSGLPVARQSVVVAVAPRAGCPQGVPSASPYTLAPASFEGDRATLELGSPACVWDISYRTANSDCQVAAQFKDRNGNPIGTANASGSLVVTSRVGTSQPTQLGSIEFTVGRCFSTFEASLSVSVTDLQAGANHASTAITATIAPTQSAPTGCSPSQTLRLTLNSSHTASARTTLAKVPEGTGTNCSYQVSFEDSLVTAGGVLLTRTSPATAELNAPPALASPAAIAAATRVAASYTASRPAAIQLTNATLFSSSHSPAARRDLVVTTTPVASQTCTDAAPPNSPHTVHAASAATAVLGARVCAWTISYANTAADCVVSAQLKEPDGTNIGATPDTDGELTIYADASRQVRSAATGGTQIGSIEFTVTSDCTDYFDGSVSISVTGAAADAHRGDTYRVTVAPASTAPPGCTASQELSLALATTNSATIAVPGLVATPVTQTACTYTVAFPEFNYSYFTSTVQQRSTAAATISEASPSATASYAESTLSWVLIRGDRRHSAIALGHTWTMTPKSGTCTDSAGMAITAPPSQDQTHAVAVPGEALHPVANYLDYRCDWEVTHVYNGLCRHTRVIIANGQANPPSTFTLTKDIANKRLNYSGGALRSLTLDRAAAAGIGDCPYDLIVAAKDGTSLLDSSGLDVSYTLAPITPASGFITNCSGSTSTRPANPETNTVNYKSVLGSRCSYQVSFTAPTVANKCFLVELAYQGAAGTEPVIHATLADPFVLESDFNVPGVHADSRYDPSEPVRARLIYGDPALNQEVNRLLVSYVDALDGDRNRQCASPLRLQNYVNRTEMDGDNWRISHSDIKLSLRAEQPGGAARACAPNKNSATVAEANAVFQDGVLPRAKTRNLGLGHNCDWLITFGATRPDCAAVAYVLPQRGLPLAITAEANEAGDVFHADYADLAHLFTVTAKPGETATLRLQPTDSRLRVSNHGSLADNNLGSQRVTGIQFITCVPQATQTAIKLVNKTPDVAVDIKFTPDATTSEGRATCRGRPVKPQTQDDIVTYDRAYLEYACDWQVSFVAENGCEVTIKVVKLGASAPESNMFENSIKLTGDPTLKAGDDGIHEDRYLTAKDNNNNDVKVVTLEYTTSTDPDDCAPEPVGQRFLLRNISDLAGIGAVNLDFALTDDTCMPNAGAEPSEFVLGPQATRAIYLARNCDWTITHSPVNSEFCTSTFNAYDATGLLSSEFSTLNLVKDDSDLTQDLKETTFDFVPVELRVNGCRNRYSQNPGFNGAKVVVIDRTAPVNAEYSLGEDGCETGVTVPSQHQNQYNDDAVAVVGEQRIHYLDFRCDWRVSASDNNYASCDFDVQFKESVEAEPFATVTKIGLATHTSVRILKRDMANRRFVHIDAESQQQLGQVGAMVITPSAGCSLPVEFVNRSEPYLVNNQGDWLYPRGTRRSPARSLPELELPFPRVALNFTPLTASGEPCAVNPSIVIKPRGVVTLDAMSFAQNSRNEPELDEQGNLMFEPDSETFQLDLACDWLVEFVGVTVAGAPWACVARAQVLGMNGERLGNPVGAGAFEGRLKTPRNEAGAEDPAGTDFGPFGGGSFRLLAGPSGVTYQGKLVGSVEFEGCLPTNLAESSSCVQEVQPADPDTQIDDGNIDGTVLRCEAQDFPEVAELHIFDAVAPVGDLKFSVRPAVLGGKVQCDGTGQPPAALDETDGLVFAEAPGSLVYHLSTRCDWVVNFERSAVCDAVSVWGVEQDDLEDKDYQHLVFVDTVSTDVLSVRLARAAAVTLDGQPPRAEDSTEVPGGLVYFPGSGGGVRLVSDALAGGGGAGGGGLPSGVAGGPQRVAGLAFECAPQVELSSVSGAAGPGLDVTVQPKEPPAAPDSGLDSVSPVCADQQRHQRYPAGVRSAAAGVGAFGSETADELPDEEAILPGESFRVALNQDCTWQVKFESRDASCVAAARVLAADGSLLGEVERTAAGSSKTLVLTAGAGGVTYADGVVAAIEFYDCFTPVVSLAAVPGVAWATPGVPDGSEFTVTFWPVGGTAGCSAGKSQTMVSGTRGLTLKQQAAAARLRPDGSRVEEVYTRVKDTPARLVGLADDGSVCEYELEVAGLSSVGQIGYRGRVSPRSGWAPLRSLAPSLSSNTLTAASLSFANDTSASSSGHTAAQRQVLVTLTPANSCSGTAAEPVGPFALGVALSATSDRTVLLGSQDCVWTVSYRNTADDCAVTVALLDSDNAPASAAFTDTSDRSFELSVRAQVADSKPAVSAKFEVGACYEEFEATIEVSVTDEVGVPGHAGTPVTVTVAPVADSNPICSSPFTVQLVLDAAGRASTTRTLARRPMGQSAAECNYEVQLPDSQLSPVGALMPASATPPRLSAVAASVTAELEAMRPAAVALRNATPLTTPYTHASQLDVVVTLEPAADCTDRLLGASPYTIVAGSAPARGVMSTANCEWRLSATNSGADCAVTLQLRGANNAAVGSLDLDGGPVSLFVVSGQVRTAASGGELVEAADFAVTSSCSTYFSGTVSVSLSDVLNGDHAGAVVPVQVSQRSPARPECHFGTGTAEVELQLDKHSSASGVVHNLVGVPLGTGAAQCEYVAVFPATVSLPGSVRLERQGEAAVLFSVSSPEAANTYKVVRPRQLLLRNTTSASSGHASDSERTVEIVVSRADLCLEGERTYHLELAAESERLVLLDPGDCAWGILLQNPAANCVVESRFQGSTGGVLGDVDVDGRQSVHVEGSRILNAPIRGSQVDLIEYKVRDTGCRVDFEATLSASVTDAASGDHSGTAVAVDLTPTGSSHADCTAIQTVTLTLGPPAQGSSAANEATETVTLIHQPMGETATCEYEAMFPAAPTTTGNVTLNRTSAATVELKQSAQASDQTATGAYTAAYSTLASGNSTTVTVRNANGTTISLAGLNVSYTLTPDCPGAVTPVPSTQQFGNATPDSNAANVGQVTHALDHRCDWTAVFTHAEDCLVAITVYDDQTSRATSLSGPVTFTKPANPSSSTKFTYNNMTADTFGISVDRLVGECHTELLVGDAAGMHALNPLPTREQGEARTISYTFSAGDCIDKDGNPSPQHRETQSRPANLVMGTVNYRHALEYRCDWNVEFSHPVHQNCLQVELAYEDEAGEVTVHAKRGLRFSLTKDPANQRLVYGTAADGLAVNRLLVSFVEAEDGDGNRVCASFLRFNHSPSPAPSPVKVVVQPVQPGVAGEPGSSQQACTPNSASSPVAEVNAGLASFSASKQVVLGVNCDWLVTFGSTNAACSVVAKLDPFGSPTVAWEAEAGETATVRFYGGGASFRAGVLHKGKLQYLTAYGLRFDSCGAADHQTAIEVVKAGSSATGVDVEYEFRPHNCRGAQLRF